MSFFSQVAKAEPGMVSKAVASRNKGDRRFREFQGGVGGGEKDINEDFQGNFWDELKSTSFQNPWNEDYDCMVVSIFLYFYPYLGK